MASHSTDEAKAKRKEEKKRRKTGEKDKGEEEERKRRKREKKERRMEGGNHQDVREPTLPEKVQHHAQVGNRELAKTSKPIKKTFYVEHKEVKAMSEEEVRKCREKLQITVENLPRGMEARPVQSFEQAGFPTSLHAVTKGFQKPSPIQSQAWPIVLAGQDLVGIAATGSGKTLAFGLPAITHILGQKGKNSKGPRCLILAPTRELCQQIGDVMEKACEVCGLKCAVVYGGVPKSQQISDLRAGAEVVTATPGRLEDLVESGYCNLQDVSFLVLDEADRMLDLGFLPHIRNIVLNIRSDRQTVMFSATWPQEVQSLAVDFMYKPVRCTIGSEGLSAAKSVSQIVEVMDPKDKDARLDAVLRKYHASRKNRVLIFVLYKKEAERVEQLLQRRGWECAGIHGDKSQADRTKAVQRFKDGKCPLLIATDVAARGLDIPDVEYVINYTFPLTSEDYVHRIGRTGRAGKTGCSHTFFTFHDKARAGELQNLLRKGGQPVPQELLSFGSTVKKKESKLYGAHFKEVDMTARPTKIKFDD